jgi:heptosyltransferase-2
VTAPFSSVLLAQTTYLGDVLLMLPLALRIREQFPDTNVDLLVRPELASLAAACPAVRRVHVMEKHRGHPAFREIRTLAQTIRSEHYDCSITLPGSIRTSLVMLLARIPRRIGWDPGRLLMPQLRALKHPGSMLRVPGASRILAFEAFFRLVSPARHFLPGLYTDTLALRSGCHRVLDALDVMELLGKKGGSVPFAPWLRIPEPVRDEVDRLCPGDENGCIVVAPGATQPTRRWPMEHLAVLVRQLAEQGHRVLIIGTEQERAVGMQLVEASGSALVRSIAGDTSVLATCEIIRRSAVLVANDSAPVHMASAMGTPVVAVFGPTLPSFGFAPLSPHSAVLERFGLSCRPCTIYGGPRCPVQTHECLRSITPHEVLAAVAAALSESASQKPSHNGRGT